MDVLKIKFNKIFILTVLFISVLITGCIADSQDNQITNDNAQSTNGAAIDEEEEIQKVMIVNSESINYNNGRSYEDYWDWHNQTSNILNEHLGQDVEIFCYSIAYSGELKEVGKYYVLLDENNHGLTYIDIDQINAISSEAEFIRHYPSD